MGDFRVNDGSISDSNIAAASELGSCQQCTSLTLPNSPVATRLQPRTDQRFTMLMRLGQSRGKACDLRLPARIDSRGTETLLAESGFTQRWGTITPSQDRFFHLQTRIIILLTHF